MKINQSTNEIIWICRILYYENSNAVANKQENKMINLYDIYLPNHIKENKNTDL